MAMSIELLSAVIHGFTKEAHSNDIHDIVKKVHLLDISLPAVLNLVSGINNLIGKPGGTVTYGQFGTDGRQGLFPDSFRQYTEANLNEISFLQLSHSAIDELIKTAREEALSTGGHILVSTYVQNNQPYSMVAMIKQKGGVVLNEEYIPTDILEIDTTKIHQAVRININRYKLDTGDNGIDNGDGDDQNYLCFVGNSRSNSASAYFVKALGCTKGMASSRATGNAIRSVQKYFQNKGMSRKLSSKAKYAVIDYLTRKLEAKEPATLDEICHEILSQIPAEEMDKCSDMREYLNGEEGKVPEQFTIHPATLRKNAKIKGEASKWSLLFDITALGETEEAEIHYHTNSKSITIKDLPLKLILDIEKELAKRKDLQEE